jgi:ParB-like chromosome segregation protein Spo0J
MTTPTSDPEKHLRTNPTELLKLWREQKPRVVPRESVKTDAALQPRVERLAPCQHWHRLEEQSAEHVACMRGVLAASITAELDPVLIAEVDGVLYLVDGHHRLRAYALEKRQGVPARVLKVTDRQALITSKLVNLDGAKLPMHNEQRKDAVWQYLAEVTYRGRLGLPAGQSQKGLAARFGVSRDTVQRMLLKLPQVDPTEFHGEALDAGTGWPRWKHVRQPSHWKDMQGNLTPDARLQRELEGFQKGFSKLLERYGAEVAHEAMHRWANESSREHAEDVRKMLEEVSGDSPDF